MNDCSINMRTKMIQITTFLPKKISKYDSSLNLFELLDETEKELVKFIIVIEIKEIHRV